MTIDNLYSVLDPALLPGVQDHLAATFGRKVEAAAPEIVDFVGGFFVLGLLVLAVNLYRLMVVRYEEFLALSVDNQFKDVRVRAPRGLIRDRRGEVLVDARPSLDVFITPAFCQRCVAEVIPRLESLLGTQDTVSRLGGDEFLLLLPAASAMQAADLAQRLLIAVAQPFQVEPYELTTTLSVGIAMYPADGDSFDTLYQRADAAMYRAKQSGRNRFGFFTADLEARTARALQIENALRRLVPVLLAGLAPFLVEKLGVAADDAQLFVASLAAVLIAGLLSVWQTFRSRQVRLTMAATDGKITEEAALAKVSAGLAPSVLTPKNEIPVLGTGKG